MNDITLFEIMIKALKDSSYRITTQRKEILKLIITHSDHLDAELILEELNRNGVKVSRATIYRTLDVLVQHRIIDKYDFRDGRAHFELKTGRRHHDHLVCIECGRIVEFERFDSMEKIHNICRNNEFRYMNHYLQVYGVCASCSNKKENT